MQTLDLHCQKVELCTRCNVQNSSIGNLMITRRKDVMLLSAITIVGMSIRHSLVFSMFVVMLIVIPIFSEQERRKVRKS